MWLVYRYRIHSVSPALTGINFEYNINNWRQYIKIQYLAETREIKSFAFFLHMINVGSLLFDNSEVFQFSVGWN